MVFVIVAHNAQNMFIVMAFCHEDLYIFHYEHNLRPKIVVSLRHGIVIFGHGLWFELDFGIH